MDTGSIAGCCHANSEKRKSLEIWLTWVDKWYVTQGSQVLPEVGMRPTTVLLPRTNPLSTPQSVQQLENGYFVLEPSAVGKNIN